MTLAEVCRALESSKRKKQEQAIFDHTFANMMAFSVGRLYKRQEFPPVEKFYPWLFSEEEVAEKEQLLKEQREIEYFKMFAAEHNKRFQEANI